MDIERALYINGSVPFFGANTLVFPRMWTDGGEVRTDNRGNQIRPTQIEVFGWQDAAFGDSLGYEAEPYRFYFEAGENTLSLEAVNEPVILGDLRLMPVQALPDYEAYAQAIPQTEMSAAARAALITVQGEDASLRSSPSLYARYDRSSPTTEPNSITTTVLNYIGGTPWRHAGEWIEWAFEVPEDGIYHITIKGRQRYSRGSVSSRILTLDGEVPFEEMKEVSFAFDNKWEMKTLGDGDGAYSFYLTAGRHTLRLEATLGGMGSILSDLDESIFRLNQIYRHLLVLTGVNPDTFRDYNLQAVYPEVIDSMRLESLRLYRIVDETVGYTGQKSDRIAAAQTLATQLETFVEDPNKITRTFTNFKDNITALGTAAQNLSEVNLDIDWIAVSGQDAHPATKGENWLSMLWHEIRSTAASYFVDYDALGDVYQETEDVLSVWILTGRDQSTVLKTMVDDTFTPETGIKVNIKLVDPTALLGAVVAGNGPDVVVSTDTWNPVNYALRNSAQDLTQFEDFDTVISQFLPSAYAALQWEGGVYGLPETQLVSLLFYRKDILDEYEMEVPDTWQDLINLLPTIQGNNMSVGVFYPTIALPNLFSYLSLIYQNGRRIYSDDATHTVVNEEPAVRAFEFYTSLYTDYGLPVEYDFLTRFRSGEMPIGISEYNTYNFLVVAAPEIRGLWDFALIPGTLRTGENGQEMLDRSVHSQGVSCMMIATEDDWVKESGWEFMKWWVSTESQLRFGREIEAVLGCFGSPSHRQYRGAAVDGLEHAPAGNSGGRAFKRGGLPGDRRGILYRAQPDQRRAQGV